MQSLARQLASCACACDLSCLVFKFCDVTCCQSESMIRYSGGS